MKRPAIFFDRDNTLIICSEYLGDPNGVVLMEGAADAVARARKLGYATVIVSNQSGVARGMYPEESVHAVNAKLDQMLEDVNASAVIDRHEFCPFHPEAVVERYKQDSDLRKPKPGMILRAAQQLALDLSRSWMIGDGARDVEAGAAAGCRTILFVPPQISQSPEASRTPKVAPDFTCSTLKEALDIIEQHPEPPEPIVEPLHLPFDPPPKPAAPEKPANRVEFLLEQILEQLKRHEPHHSDFSVTKLLGGVTQILSIAVLVFSYFNPADRQMLILLAIALQVLTISLIIMGRQST